MKKLIILSIILTTFIQINAQITLKISSNNRYLEHLDGTPFFPNGQTCWEIPWDLTRSEVETFLQRTKEQKFNIVGINSFDWDQSRNSPNRYGEQPFVMVNGKYDPSQPITTNGNNPNNSTEYDYWDHLEYIIDLAASKDIYVVLLPAWGSTRISGGSSSRIFNINNAYTYGYWIGNRFRNKTNIIWMMGGDAIPDQYTDYKPVYRKMAEGVADGVNGTYNNDGNADYSTTLMSYHPPKWSHSSSFWFQNDAFLDFNSVQDQPSDQINRIQSDYSKIPVKPTWLFEGGYEARTTSDGPYTDWQCRFQAYQTIFAGGFGHFYGHMSIWDFDSDWSSRINDPGINDMQHLYTLMTSLNNEQFTNRIPDQGILDGNTGTMTGDEGIFSNCIVATRTINGDFAMIYTANGSNIRVKMENIAAPMMSAKWFNPRTGEWLNAEDNIPSGNGAAIHEFDPPGNPANGNDYVLILNKKNNDALFINLQVPTTIPSGTNFNISIKFKNTGITTWSAGTNYALGAQNPADNTFWGTNRIQLPYDVAPNQEVIFNTTLTTPNQTGTYNFQWQMVQDGEEWFGQLSNNIPINVTNDSINFAHFISQLYPSQIAPNDSFYVELKFRNDGTTIWQATNNYALGSQNSQDNITWGTNRIQLPYDVYPGDTVTITSILQAPSTEGIYNFQWQMVQDGIEWFGDFSNNVTINVANINNSEFINQLIPLNVSKDSSFNVVFYFKNTGTNTWSSSNNYALGTQNPQDNTTWSTNRINLPYDISPGDTAIITANLTAPNSEGNFNFQWQMVQDGVEWFGDTSSNILINVGPPAYNETVNIFACEGDTINFGNQILTETGIYTHTFTSIEGYDSTVTMYLTINQTPEVELGEDTNICYEQSLLILDAGNNADSYLWSDGSTNQTLTVNNTIIGETTYYVTVSSNNCQNTDSISINVDICNEVNNFSINKLKIYPNPGKGLFYLQIDNFENTSLSIYDCTGKQVYNKIISNKLSIINLNNKNKGVYLIKLKNNNKYITKKLVIIPD